MSHLVPEGAQNSFLSNKFEIEYDLGKYEVESACSSYYVFLIELKAKKTWIKKPSVPETHNTGFLR